MSGDSEKQKLEAALEQLEAEQRRRVEEKIEKGHAVPASPLLSAALRVSLTGSIRPTTATAER
jgi:hypothetical protein